MPLNKEKQKVLHIQRNNQLHKYQDGKAVLPRRDYGSQAEQLATLGCLTLC